MEGKFEMRRRRRRSPFTLNTFIPLFRKTSLPVLFFIGIAIGYFSFEPLNPKWQSTNEPQKLNVCFTPGGKCTDLIVHEIGKAKHSIKMQTYSFTSHPIAEALVEASKRGVKVEALIDRTLLKNPHSVLPLLKANRIRFKVDRVPGIAHNKVIILDNDSVITGSFNFTKAAQERNSENVVLIKDPLMVKYYLENWNKRASS